ncbi:MAG: rhodanese-like domain-containing protein [Gammaproteobacteria bacterium]|nr:rhodanese-like domain-containing protein [Gammaproteobacteria bacterium]
MLLLFLALTMTAGCQENQQSSSTPSSTESTAKPSAEEEVVIDTARYIRSTDLLERIENESGHFVFDVRSKESYAQSHVRNALSMPYGQFEPQDVAALAQMSLDTPIVTYCGCPHHLAGLAADRLIEWGYREVRVLYEGFWHWKDNQYPIAGLQTQQTRELQLAGIILSGDRPLMDTDVFIRNTRNGQLEAAETDASGRFETGFHVLDYRPDDQFEVRVGSLDAPVAHRLSAGLVSEKGILPVFRIEVKG